MRTRYVVQRKNLDTNAWKDVASFPTPTQAQSYATDLRRCTNHHRVITVQYTRVGSQWQRI